jgi:hypothetical protein
MNIIKAVAHLNELTQNVTHDYCLQHQSAGTLYTVDLVHRLEQKQIATNNVNGAAFLQQFAVCGDKQEKIGVWFNDPDSGLTIRMPTQNISLNTPSKLQFVLPPEVVPGTWKISVATQAQNKSTTILNNVRIYEYPNSVEVL